MKKSLTQRIRKIIDRFNSIEKDLMSPDLVSQSGILQKLSKERAELLPIVETFTKLEELNKDLSTTEEWLDDPELKSEAIHELEKIRDDINERENQLQKLLLPKDPNDERNVILEIRAGTGGDESALFAADLFRMYCRYAERQKWKIEILNSSESDLGGFKEIIIRLIGKKVFSFLKFESGGHRVQRIPVTETQGRIHTSACTVAVLPEMEKIDEIIFLPEDLRIDVFRASGAGGQHVNKTESAVRITHIPTGTVAECQDDRSQHKNKEKAMKVLSARVLDKELSDKQQKLASTRKILIGSGDRSERVRTYNFPQGRVTDHRIALTSYKLEQIMDGDLHEFTNSLISEHQANLMASVSDNAG